ncbi:hypothetical protein [Nonomuraea angiospora]|uniref:hypothetical protein n=1 Tax=Nonomuraea angiospora TaxID=46172 RepID=UPI0029B61905|nr:hypothetical protein [Nonomuraea angiospora]MDX3103937.1 hypothetical protein [Nonomuraea angiospora]
MPDDPRQVAAAPRGPLRRSSGETAAHSSNRAQAARRRATPRAASDAARGSWSRSGTAYGAPKSVMSLPWTRATTTGSPGAKSSPARAATAP